MWIKNSHFPNLLILKIKSLEEYTLKNRQTKLLVDIDAMKYNYNKIKELQPNKKILPVLKAGGYGIGLEAIKNFIEALKIDICRYCNCR